MGVGVSALVQQAIAAAGLADVAAARRAGALSEAQVERLRQADLLALGALADAVRAEEVGVDVKIFADGASPAVDERLVVLPPDSASLTGLELLREVAVARVAGPRGARVRVDWGRCGLELAQVALGFGADELAGPIANKRGLPLAQGEMLGVGKKSGWEPADVVKRRELASCVERGGRVAVFVGRDGLREPREPHEPIEGAGPTEEATECRP
jgi:hypothetical protein